ncbi:MAG: hypothetical protein M1495_22970 [Bacteroidetes bacterium]|nr:hypothetical protein [Bacteroidota bacterium]MCL6097360.1 hypothetical protein [Bacteroidota bacterium]
MKKKFSILLLSICIFAGYSAAQTKSNLEVIYSLIDRSVAKADSVIGGKQNIFLSVTDPQALDVLKPRIQEAFNSKKYVLIGQKDEAHKSIDYTLVSAKVEYKDSFSDGIFGGTLLLREISLTGSFSVETGNGIIKPHRFSESVTDTVNLDELNSIENQALPFTQAPVPSLPLLSNLWEPIIVVGTLIVTVVLLFTVRSK